MTVSQTCIFLEQENQFDMLFEVVCEEAYSAQHNQWLFTGTGITNTISGKTSIIQFLEYYNGSDFVYRYI